MAALRPDRAKTSAAGAIIGTPGTHVSPRPGRYEHNVTMPVSLSIEQSAVTPRSFNAHASTRIDRTEFGVAAYRGVAGRYLDMTVEVRCVRT